MTERFLRTLNYASVNEDWRTEAAALRPEPYGRILCVTGSGDRPLNLLARSPARVVAIDVNPAQNHLLRLKVAALQFLPYEEYVAFLGLRPGEPAWRRDLFLRLRSDLLSVSRRFWEARIRWISSGVLYEGRWERFYRRLSRFARLIRPRAIEALFEFDELGAQRRFVEDQWDTPLWRRICAALCAPLFSRLFFGDPAYYRRIDLPAGPYIYDRMRQSLGRHLARENFMISLVLRGELSPFDLPPCLTPEGVAALRGRLDRLEVVTGDLLEALESSPEGSFTGFSLSDVPSFLDRGGFERVLRGVSRCGSRGARFCIRQFLTRHGWPGSAFGWLSRDRRLELRLAAEDRSFAYDFFAGEVCHA